MPPGVSHSIWDEDVTFGSDAIVEARPDPALDPPPTARSASRRAALAGRSTTRTRFPRLESPELRTHRRWPALRAYLSRHDNHDEACYFPDDWPAPRHLPAPALLRSCPGTAARPLCGTTAPATWCSCGPSTKAGWLGW